MLSDLTHQWWEKSTFHQGPHTNYKMLIGGLGVKPFQVTERGFQQLKRLAYGINQFLGNLGGCQFLAVAYK